jgi:hypothetical protein
MVEAICVISIFILFFLGMVYFRSLYQQKLRISRLARTAAVGYALNGCQGDPLAMVSSDLGSASNGGGSGQQAGSAAGPSSAPGSNPSVGQNTGNPVGSALSSQGMVGDPIAVINMQAPAGATTQPTPWAAKVGFSATLTQNSYMSCGDVPQAGTAAGAWSYASQLFSVP